MSGIQVALVLFALFALSRVMVGLRRGTITRTPFILWAIFWVAAIVVTLLPDTTAALAKVFGVGRGVDLAIYVALMALFYLMFRVFARLEDLERQLTKLVRNQALADLRPHTEAQRETESQRKPSV